LGQQGDGNCVGTVTALPCAYEPHPDE
ncbi:MAG: hypothetical protein ACI82G_001545, partial [Bradymonadia bacterium]